MPERPSPRRRPAAAKTGATRAAKTATKAAAATSADAVASSVASNEAFDAALPGDARTVVYVHGIGNKPVPAILKCQWDDALFGFDLGERSRLAYWVNRDYYPQPEGGTCRSGDRVALESEPTGAGLSVKQHLREAPLADELEALVDAPDDGARDALRRLAQRLEAGAARQEAAYAAAARGARAQGAATRRATAADVGDAPGEADANGVRPDDVVAAARALAGDERTADDRAAAAAAGVAAAGVGARILPLPPVLRRWLTRTLTRALLRDVNDFLFVEARRERMRESLRARLRVGGGPFVVVAHSQGSMVAYDVLSAPEFRDLDVRLLVTVGSPLGLQEVQDELRRLTGQGGGLRVPPGVRRWLNVADPLDPVALDKGLAGDFAASDRGVRVEDDLEWNPDSPRHPHSGTGYLRTKPVQRAVRESVATGLFQPVADFVVARDVVRAFENGGARVRQPVLVELAGAAADGARALDAARRDVVARILALARASGARAAAEDGDGDAAASAAAAPTDDALRHALRLEELRRFVAADLTREEAEALAAAVPATAGAARAVSRVWRNARKVALLDTSVHTVQASPAHAAYQATGRGIAWAVLDSGVNARHPHFRTHDTVVCQYDCTQRGRLPTPTAARRRGGAAGDDNGHGTHVAGIIAGEHQVDGDGDARRLFRGIAPETQLHDYRVLDRDGNGEDAWILKALDHIADVNERAGSLVIHGVNLSLGGPFDQSTFGCGHTPLCNELRRLWRQGVLVVLAAGNEGFAVLQTLDGTVDANMDLSIGDPANLEEAIAVGSVHKAKPHTYGVSYFSSRGPTADGRQKPDLVAPGERILSCRHRVAARARATADDLYVEMSGTSMAAPHVSGVLAAFLSARREFVGQPDRVKELLLQHCTDLKRDRPQQGAGMPNLVRMLVAT